MRSNRVDMLFTEQLVFCVMTHVFLYRTSYSDCEFPRQWWGRWHQTGIGELVIRANEISTKGTCYEQYREYFLVENRHEHCHQCMTIVRRHPNIIQYRESYCIGREALQSICGQMRVEGFGAMYTLVRDAALPVACPFQKAFHFTYNNQSGGFCRSPTSYAHQCSTGTMLRLYFRQCRHCMHTYDSDVEFECLATWKDGNDHFAYGIFIGENFLNREESYRCFVYQKTGSVIYMAISSDATCRGLRSPKEGPLVLELTEDIYGWPTPRCTFPSWLASTSWIDTSGQLVYTFSAANDVIAVHSQRKNDFSVAHARAVFKCLKTDGRPGNESSTSASTGNTTTGDVITLDTTNITVLTHVLEKCQSRHRCLRIQRRHLSLMHIYTGSYVRDSKELCTDEHFTREQSQHDLLVTATLSSSDRRGNRCPTKKGRYLALRTAGKCQPELRIGCSQQDQLDVVSQCQAEQPLVQLACLFSWKENDVTFLIARKIDTNESICFNLRRQDNRLMLTATEQCSQYDTDRHVPLNTVYVFQSTRERCQGQTVIDDEDESEDPRDNNNNNNRDVQRDIDSDEAIAPTWHLSDKTPSKRIEESSPRLSNASRSLLLPTDRIRTRIIVALLTTMLLTSALTHILPK